MGPQGDKSLTFLPSFCLFGHLLPTHRPDDHCEVSAKQVSFLFKAEEAQGQVILNHELQE